MGKTAGTRASPAFTNVTPRGSNINYHKNVPIHVDLKTKAKVYRNK